jgi:hypothetical protein
MDILPQPLMFTRDAVRVYQNKLVCAEWRRHADPLVSAKLLLKAAATPGGIGQGSPVLEEVPLPEDKYYEVIALSVPKLLKDLASDIREVLTDSTCICCPVNR